MKNFPVIVCGLIFLLIPSFELTAQVLPLKPFFASDVMVTNMTVRSETKTRVAVAENGFIYIMAFIDIPFYDEKGWEVWKSADEGKTFQKICHRTYSNANLSLADVDFIVTGYNQNDISVFVAEVGNTGTVNAHNCYCMVTKYKANGDSVGVVYNYDWGANTTLHVAIASDFRSPDEAFANPYNIAVAWTGSVAAGNSDHLTYAISNDAGATFTDYFLYDQPGPKHLGRVSLSLGSAPGAFGMFVAAYGVAFEMNKEGETGEIGLIMNYLDNNGGWKLPVRFTSIGNYNFPSVSLRQRVPLVTPSSEKFSMLLTLNAGSWIQFNTLKSTYNTFDWPQPTSYDFNMGGINGTPDNVKDCSNTYNKNDDSYLLTYATSLSHELRYIILNASDFTAVVEKGNYRDQFTEMSWRAFPSVDINLKKNKACFSWTDVPNGNFQSIYFDSEWSTVGTEDYSETGSPGFSFYPNPASGIIHVSTNHPGKSVLRGCSMTGNIIFSKEIKTGNNLVDLAGIAKGIYLLKFENNGNETVRKLVIK